MTNSVLQDFLDNRFIKTADESDLDKLKKASADIQKQLRKNKSKVINYTLVALDPVIPDDDPVVCEVEIILIKHWKAFKNSVANTQDKPITYIQAVILDALQTLSKDIEFAAIIWHSSCHMIHYYKLAGQEEVLKTFLMPIGHQLEECARNNWSISENIAIEAIKPIHLSLPKSTQAVISREKLEEHLIAAAVHLGWAAQAGGGENPQAPTTGNAAWAKFLAERTATGLSQEINSALKAQGQSIEGLSQSIEDALNSAFGEMQTYLKFVSSSVQKSTESQSKRSNLLWWKQSLYSNTLDKSYRQVQGLTATLAMSVDLNNSVDDIYPKSVDYFLEETLRDVLEEKINAPIKLNDLLKQLISEEKELLQGLIYEYKGRKLFGSYLAEVVNGSMSENEFFQFTGFETDEKITLAELAVWLIHDLKAHSLANSK